ncbi:MAG: winged helix-turn-helix domain-containing protein [Candidatus Avoscillospira sp.]
MIYVLEDDGNIRKLILYTLRTSGFEAEGFDRPSAFWPAMEARKPRLLLLDIMLPEEDGLSILKKLRLNPDTAQLPIIMLTAKGSEYDKVIGLDSGADDYVPKPFGMMELVSRVKAVLRRAEPAAQEEYRLGDLYVCPAKHIVMAGDQEIKLALKEFELLVLLLRNAGVVLTRDALLNQIWGYSFDGESRTVDVHIRNLRKKLGDAGACIETVKGVGYKIGGTGLG